MVKEFNPIYPPPHLFHWKPEPPLQNFNPCPPMLQSQTIPTFLPVAANLVPVQNDGNLQEPQSQVIENFHLTIPYCYHKGSLCLFHFVGFYIIWSI